jgi:hypothetical protein
VVAAEVFGHDIRIDPRAHVGRCVRKSDANALHDGSIIDCPIAAPERGYVYQRVIDNAVGDGTVQDIRLPVFGELVPFCYLKYRPVANRFANVNSRVELSTTDSVISEDELARFRRFCRAMRNEDARRGIRGRFWQPHEIGGREGCGPASRTLLGQ